MVSLLDDPTNSSPFKSENHSVQQDISALLGFIGTIERAMVRAMCGAKLMEKKRTEDLMEMLGLKETAVQMAKVNGVRWYGHVLSRDDGHVLRKALKFEVRGKRKPGRQKKIWKIQVEKESKSVGLRKRTP